MNRHALAVLEMDQVLEIIARRASSELGARLVRELKPTNTPAWIHLEHERVSAMRSLVAGDVGWRPERIPDIVKPLERLRVTASSLSGPELLDGATLLRSSRITRAALINSRQPEQASRVLEPFAQRLFEQPDIERTVETSIDDEGRVRDSASPALRRVRRELRGAAAALVQLLEKLMARLDERQRVADMSVTMRGGRYVIPVRREARTSLGGIVHGESDTGGTLFVEPPAAVEFGNRIRELEAQEQREEDRILRELTESLRPLAPQMLDALDALAELDSLYARARFAEEFACKPSSFTEPSSGFRILSGRHPLLLDAGIDVVPFDLEMVPDERTLLLSGPNTGGKTVLLKAIGLLSSMAQAGIPPTVGEGSRIAIFDDVFADIGDEQSIQASLSTFSAHLKNLAEILTGATARCLVLVDELGSGTDPVEGAALGGAILEELTARGALTIATTHLGALKMIATETPAVVNASLQFDDVQLAPTFRLIKGIPGRSYGLAIAARLKIPPAIIHSAEGRLPHGERDVTSLLADLEQRVAELAGREQEVAAVRESLSERQVELQRRESAVRDAARSLEKQSRLEARQFLLESRNEVERIIRGLKAAESTVGEVREARRQIEALAAEQADALKELEHPEMLGETSSSGGALTVGDSVSVPSLGGRTGRLLELRGNEAVVGLGAIKLTVSASSVSRVGQEARPAETVHLAGDLPDIEAPSEIDLRGMRVDETERTLLHTIDSAVRADLKMLRIIHGKGTGALRERVAELLQSDARVRSYRLGAWNEGGSGVTIAELS